MTRAYNGIPQPPNNGKPLVVFVDQLVDVTNSDDPLWFEVMMMMMMMMIIIVVIIIIIIIMQLYFISYVYVVNVIIYGYSVDSLG